MTAWIVWDWNGTLIADSDACRAAGNRVIAATGGKPLPRKQYQKQFDFPATAFYEAQGCDPKKLKDPANAQLFHDFYEQTAAKVRTRSNARQILLWLKKQGSSSVILSNHLEENIRHHLRRLQLETFFDAILANTDHASTVSGNNKIHRLAKYLKKKKLSPRSGIIVGDAPEDIAIGKKLGLTTIAIFDGYYSNARLRAAKPDHCIYNLKKIQSIVKKMNGPSK